LAIHGMKRQLEHTDDSGSKKQRSTPATALMVPAAAVSGLIGKSGAQIRQIEGTTGAKVSFGAADVTVLGEVLRRVDITAESEVSITAAVVTIAAMVQAATQEAKARALLLVPNGAVAKVIGAKGSVIGRITQASGAYVSFAKPQEMPPELGTERLLTISGEASQVGAAQQIVGSVLATIEGGGTLMQPAPHSRAPVTAYAGYSGMDPAYAGIQYTAAPQFTAAPGATATPPGAYGAMQGGQQGLQQSGYPLAPMVYVPSEESYSMPYAPIPPPPLPVAPYGQPPSSTAPSADMHCTVYIPSALVGSFIGAKGREIKNLQMQCHDKVHISVAKEDSQPLGELGPVMRPVALKGRPEFVYKAQQIIQTRFEQARDDTPIEWILIGRLKATTDDTTTQ